MKKKLILLAVAAVLAVTANAYDFMAEGFAYDVIDNKSVKVVSYEEGHDLIDIPQTVIHDGSTFIVREIGVNAFMEYSVDIPIVKVVIPFTITRIGNDAFCERNGWDLIIPNTLVGEVYAFDNCGINSLTIIGKGNFPECFSTGAYFASGIQTTKELTIGSEISSTGNIECKPLLVRCYSEIPPNLNANTFASYDGELHVPASAASAYFTADYWQNFTNMQFDANDKVLLNKTEVSMSQWDELTLIATTGSTAAVLAWSTTNPRVATVSDDGVVTAVAAGECDIFASLADNPAVYASCHISAAYPEITLALDKNEAEVNLGDGLLLNAIITPDNTGLAPTWTSSDESVAIVDADGVVTAVGEGECDITASLLDKTATCHVTVTGTVSITLDMLTATITPNEILTVYPTCTPDVEVDFTVSSSDTSVAIARIINRSIASAFGAPALAITKAIQIMGIKDGTATITVGSVNGKATPATIEVTVQAVSGVEDINVDNNGSQRRYNVFGQPVGKDYKGIVIEDGKKLIVR